eukprot:TRINITY_DN3398_c0_g1_i2.p1 TRINITY_DN3398_c0_g1~~TRINITY_DN3398_c0_g1_i2.p1  ORF type:complete len:202 (+),score=51.39 TRINITY_DN3398_c0_g1_i2:218-823(+)
MEGGQRRNADLFGGALNLSIPTVFVDISQFRQVPDNQEVFVDVDRDQSIVVELLSYETGVPNNRIGVFCFSDIAETNNAAPPHSEVLHTSELKGLTLGRTDREVGMYTSLVVGRQSIAKFNEQARNLVNLYVAVVRIPSVTTDLVISFNEAIAISPESSSAKTASEITPGTNLDPNATFPMLNQFKEMVLSLKVNDWSLFG